jgi:outer membrane protein assembly factor BamB
VRPRPLLLALLAVGAALAPAASPAHGATPRPIDWPTYGFDVERSGSNPYETTINPTTARALTLKWSSDLGDVMIAQPVEAANVPVNGKRRNIVYVGTEHGDFYALRASNGSTLWQRGLGSVSTGCYDMPDGIFGIGGAAVIDRPHGRLFVAGGDGSVYALDLATGAIEPGWPMKNVFDPTLDHVYSGLNYDAMTGQLYVATASHCDFGYYHGHVFQIDVATRTVKHTFVPAGAAPGGGVWGPGGVSLDAATHHVFAATGNALTSPEYFQYAENVVELTRNLRVLGSNYPGLTGGDVDFGATPILYQAPGCPPQVTAKNKTGVLVTYTRGQVGQGPTQRLQVANVYDWQFNGIPAYSASTRTLYIGNSSDSSDTPTTAYHGMVALQVGSDCKLHVKWQQIVGPNYASVSPPTVAGGVVFYGDGYGDTEFAFDAKTGERLWDSGSTIGGGLYAAPMVVNGRLYVASWDHHLYSFGP